MIGLQPKIANGPLAQLAAQLTLNQTVPGSSPGRPTPYLWSTRPEITPCRCSITVRGHAGVVKMANTPALGAGARKSLEVQVLSPAQVTARP